MRPRVKEFTPSSKLLSAIAFKRGASARAGVRQESGSRSASTLYVSMHVFLLVHHWNGNAFTLLHSLY